MLTEKECIDELIVDIHRLLAIIGTLARPDVKLEDLSSYDRHIYNKWVREAEEDVARARQVLQRAEAEAFNFPQGPY